MGPEYRENTQITHTPTVRYNNKVEEVENIFIKNIWGYTHRYLNVCVYICIYPSIHVK